MARNRFLPALSIFLVLAAGGAWLTWWALQADHLPGREPLLGWAAFRQELTVAAAAALVLLAAFRTMARALGRKDHRAARTVGHLQSLAAVVLAVVTFAVLATDFSSTLISLGLVGFGLTLALQRPILAMAGWATIVAGRMFREGDRIQVGDVEGDVLAIGLFTTRLWEIGKPDSRSPGRPTARVRTVSNAVFLEQGVANATSDTVVVFDEFVVNVAFEADLALARKKLAEVASEVLDPKRHEDMASTYRRLTRGMAMEAYFPDKPTILMESRPSWMDLRLRYLVDARQAARVQTRLTEAWTAATADLAAIPQVYARNQPMRVGGDGRPLD